MANICLAFGTRTPVDQIRNALTSVEGLKAWWTDGTSGDPNAGGVLQFRFGGNGGFDMRVLQSDEQQVQWECVTGPEDWVGTRIGFEIRPEGLNNRLLFRHSDWRSENSHYHHCSLKWGTFMLSLRDYLESGTGRPFPEDVKIEVMN